jgi:hypothetical protein
MECLLANLTFGLVSLRHILAVVDTLEAMTHDRPYRRPRRPFPREISMTDQLIPSRAERRDMASFFPSRG